MSERALRSRIDRSVPLAALTVSAVLLAACGGDSDSEASGPATSDVVSATIAPAVTETDPSEVTETTEASEEPSPDTTTPDTTTPETTVPATTAPATVPAEEIEADIEAVLANALAPGAIGWTQNGVDMPPTAIVAAVRIPGRDDVLVGVGENTDGTPVDATAPFSVATLTTSLVRTVALQLVDDGTLDTAATVDQWAPSAPNADRVTVQMLLEYATGWGESGPVQPDPVLADLERAWTLREVVELRSTVITADDEPGAPSPAGLFIDTVLGLIVEEVTGRPLAAVVHDQVAVPAGLDETLLTDGTDTPADIRHGKININDAAVDTASVPSAVAYFTYNQAISSVVSTPSDLLDLLDAWHSGDLFTTDRTPAPDHFGDNWEANPDTRVGVNVPFNGYCPCIDTDDGPEIAKIGRTPFGPFSKTFLLRYADGISVVMTVNTGAVSDPAQLGAVVDAVHDIAARDRA
jgi:CubicO group peptidase (beta-lactamase class C family)